MPLITYADKVQLNNNPDIPDNQKCMAKDMNEIKKAINDLIRPVGSYYETSDTSFDPNATWGGTWVLDSAGKVTVAKDEDDTDFDTLGKTGGEKEHTLTVNEMPAHKHGAALNSPTTTNFSGSNVWGVAYSKGSFDQAYIDETGGSQAHNNMQPYIVVNRWHRTA